MREIKVSGGLVKLINQLTLLLVFFIPLSLSFILTMLHAKGGRLSQSASYIHGALIMTARQPIRINIIDCLNIILFCLISIFFIKNRQSIRQVLNKNNKSFYVILAFSAWALISLCINFHAYTQVQWTACLLYLIKFSSILIIYIYVSFYLTFGGNFERLFKTILISVFIASIVGILSKHNTFLANSIVRDRESYFGVLSLLTLLIISTLKGYRCGQCRLSKSWYYFSLINLTLASYSIISCEKRNVVLAFIITCTLLLILLKRARLYFLFLLIGILAATPKIHHMASSVFPATSRLHPWSGLTTKLSYRLKNSEIIDFVPLHISSSITSRIARNLLSMDLIKNAPILGTGFWGVQYIYNFLPDSLYFQVLLETGLVGGFFIFIIFLSMLYRSIKTLSRKIFIGYITLATLTYFAITGTAGNILYLSNCMAVGWLIVAMTDFYYQKTQGA